MSGIIKLEDKIIYGIQTVTCFLCNFEFNDEEEPWLIFEKRIDESGKFSNALCDLLSSMLNVNIEEAGAHSSVICDKCNASLLEYEELEAKLKEIQSEIQINYRNTMNCILRKKNYFKTDNNVSPSTIYDADEQASEINEIGFEPVQLSETDATAADVGFSDIIQEDKEEESHILLNAMPLIASHDKSLENLEISLPENIEYSTQQPIESSIISEINEISEDLYTNHTSDILENMVNDKSLDFEVFDTSGDELNYNTKFVEENEDIYKKVENHFVCLTCNDDQQLDAQNLVIHMRTLHNHTFFKCNLCANSFVRQRDLDEHVLSDHSNKAEIKCTTCERHFSNSRMLRLHKRTHYNYNTKQFECKICYKKYNSKNLLEEHNNVHTGRRPFKCTMCGKDFSSKYTLQSHLKIHTERQRPYECDQCEKTFLNQQNLKQHKKLHNGVKPIKCNICEKSFSTQHNLNLHMVVHTNAKPFVCHTCGKSFARRPEIKDHERIHSGERPFKCDMCPMAFAQRSNLNSHKKSTHFNEKLHICQECNRSFKRRRLLDYHIQAVHTGERPHKCNVCSATFVYPEHYKKHMLIHSGHKPYACEICGKQFNSRDNRNAHRFVHSDKKPYECMECGAGFMRKPLLLAHMQQTEHDSDKIIVNQPQFNRPTSQSLNASYIEYDEYNEDVRISDAECDSQNNLDDFNIIEVVSDEQLGDSDSIDKLIQSNAGHELIATVNLNSSIQDTQQKMHDIKYLQLEPYENNVKENEKLPWDIIKNPHQ